MLQVVMVQVCEAVFQYIASYLMGIVFKCFKVYSGPDTSNFTINFNVKSKIWHVFCCGYWTSAGTVIINSSCRSRFMTTQSGTR